MTQGLPVKFCVLDEMADDGHQELQQPADVPPVSNVVRDEALESADIDEALARKSERPGRVWENVLENSLKTLALLKAKTQTC